jgi:large subunit ribosomal protein L9
MPINSIFKKKNMKILFVKNVSRQGSVGEIKEVPNGFAQFLISNKNAVVATEAVVAANKKKIEEAQMKSKGEESYAIDVAKRLEGKEVKIKGGANNKGSLYKALHKKDILDILSREIVVTIPEILFEEVSIKACGPYDLKMSFKGKNLGTVKVIVG